MRHRLSALVIFTLVSATTHAVAQVWKEHRPDGAGYVVEMPGEPKISWRDVPTPLGDIKTYIAASEHGTLGFVTMYSRYPETYTATADSILDGGRDGAVANSKGKLRTETMIKIGNFPGREILIDTPAGRVMMIRYFLRGKMLIQALSGGPAGADTNADVRRFLDSLRSTAEN